MTTMTWKLMGISHYYPKEETGARLTALDRVTFSQPYGKIVGIIGGKGAGKTTLAKLLLNELTPSEGLVLGQTEHPGQFELPPRKANERTGEAYVKQQLVQWGIAKKKLPELLATIQLFSELGDRFQQKLSHYSQEEKAQLAISLLLHVAPSVIYLNEPLLTVKEDFHIKVFLRLELLKNLGSSIWIETDTIKRIDRYCDQVVWLEFGQLQKHGDITEVLMSYYDYYFQIQRLSMPQQHQFWQEGYETQVEDMDESDELVQGEESVISEIEPATLLVKEEIPEVSGSADRPEESETVSRRHRQARPLTSSSPYWLLGVGGAILGSLLILTVIWGALNAKARTPLPLTGAASSVQPKESQTVSFSSAAPMMISQPAHEASVSAIPLPDVAKSDLTHVVTSGETLEQIASVYGVSVSDLQAVNQSTDPTIYAGETLALPQGAQKLVSSSESVSDVALPSTSEVPENQHIVTQGDTLYSIARRYGVDVMAIQQANALQTEQLTIGQTLRLP
ncbi:LysM peptidoglycan-binding domain-containing protein [Vagococcus sp. BWB3-3]|uniref:LysM peptidoglycan-binding domain-containing protein n=1 Tax=Vagococcus allomyrinae TaxID=2794353 RepID=A0A940P5H3_9ENTE|nr:LysM peptidoglycan-binding domain-containing protein [Vagococcus allomyrinae]MBP1040126.1 LysM peptidoglycan-binding domain-containing protein [Vagococcus allomyrinae]